MRKHIEKLQYITHSLAPHSPVEQVLAVCQAGAKWVQYRNLNAPQAAMLVELEQIIQICDDWGTTLILTNHTHLKGQVDVQGFHLDNPEDTIAEIREHLGDEYILGASATHLEQALQHAQHGADYIGVGPFANSLTKPNAYTHLSIADYQNICAGLKANGFDIPVIAVGGILISDVSAFKNTAVHGIAISGSIYTALAMEIAFSDFYKAL